MQFDKRIFEAEKNSTKFSKEIQQNLEKKFKS